MDKIKYYLSKTFNMPITQRQIRNFSAFMNGGRSDLVHRHGLGYCEPNGRPHHLSAPHYPAQENLVKISAYEKSGASHLLSLENGLHLSVADLPAEEVASIVGKLVESPDRIGQARPADSKTRDTSYSALERNLYISLGTVTIDLATGRMS